MTEHTDKHYEEELTRLTDLILKMGGLVEEMISNSMRSLTEKNISLTEKVSVAEKDVNHLEMDIDDLCITLLALRQPAASDLRFIAIGLKITKDLERMGDLAVNIAEQVRDLGKEAPRAKPLPELSAIAAKSQEMVNKALSSFVSRDEASAQSVCEMDDVVDQLNGAIRQTLIDSATKDPHDISAFLHYLAISRNLERIADHATNIAEEVIFVVKGKDIRHKGKV